jgi:hypothetical protein
MSPLGWLLLLLIAYGFLSDLFSRNWCSRHGVLGQCQRCEEEAAARVKAEAEAEAEARAEAKRQRIEIIDIYWTMDDAKRDELTALVNERAEREDLHIGPGDLEAAVVRIYRRSPIKHRIGH